MDDMNMRKNVHYTLFFLIFSLTSNLSYGNDSLLVSVQPSFQITTVSGFTRARHILPIISEASGKVTHIYADIGQTINENGIFACLDDTFINLDIDLVNNSITQHGIDFNYLNKQVERHKKLVKSKSAAVSLLDDLIRQRGNTYHAIQSAKIKKLKLKETKARHCIKAPAKWSVTARHIEVGQWINAGIPIAEAGDYSQLIIPLSLTKEELDSLQKKQNKLTVYLPEYQQKLPATIEHISPAFNEKSHKIRVNLLLSVPKDLHRGGIRTELRLQVPDKLHAFLISKKALDERFEEVWLIRKNGERIRVMLLDFLNNKTAKVSSSKIKAGDQFKLIKH